MLTQKQFDDALERLSKMQELARDLGCLCKRDCLHCKEWADKSCPYIAQAHTLLNKGWTKQEPVVDESAYKRFVACMNEIMDDAKRSTTAKLFQLYNLWNNEPDFAERYFVKEAF